MKRVVLKLCILISLILLYSCENRKQKFNRNEWINTYDMDYSKRQLMVEDLRRNFLYKGMKYSECVKLLGKPEIIESTDKIGYILAIDYGRDIDPVKGEDLIIQMTKDSDLVKTEILKWENN